MYLSSSGQVKTAYIVMWLRGVSAIATASVLMMLQCCNHTCLCENTAEDDENDLVVEVEEEMAEAVDIFQPTHEWKTVEEGQAIPPGLHVRMNIQTGAREAKLMSDSNPEEEATDTDEAQDIGTPQSQPTESATDNSGGTHPGFIFKGDQRRTHHYGHSDRRGIINKRRKAFSQKEVAEALKKMDESEVDLANLPGIAYSEPASGKSSHSKTATTSDRSDDVTIVQHDREPRIKQIMHPDLAQMMEHAETLTRETATVPELLQALEELEYHVHHFENAKELNSIGGLVVVVRLLNHTNPEVRSSAAHVIGAAAQRYNTSLCICSITESLSCPAILKSRQRHWATELWSCCVGSLLLRSQSWCKEEASLL